MLMKGKTRPEVDAAKAAAAANEARRTRDRLLEESDFTQLDDVPDKIDRTKWRVYRQKLRDITKQSGFPLNVIWPEDPTQ